MERKVRSLIKEAMMEKNKNKQITYKSILENAQKYAKNDGNREVTDADFVKAAKNEIKALEDLKQYVKDGTDKAIEIAEKISYCEVLLPKMVSKDEILTFLEDNDVDKNIGVCMKTLKAQFGDALDGKMAQSVAKEYISLEKEEVER